MEETEKLYTIGRIAKMCNIPPHQLRADDKCGIFSPEIRDENNNYRYYSERQLGDLLLIQELNRFGIPLKTIVALVQNQELFLLKSMLEENLQQMRRELEQKQLQYHQLVDALQTISIGILRAYNDTRIISLVCFTSYWIIGLPLGFTLARTDWLVPAMGPAGFWISYIVALGFGALCYLIRVHHLHGLDAEAVRRRIQR